MVQMFEVPERSIAQRDEALLRANHVRTYRAEMKGEVKARRVSAALVLLEVPEEVETMKVFDLLMAVPKHGRVKVNGMLARHRISPSKTIGGLTERQRHELVVALGAYGRVGRG